MARYALIGGKNKDSKDNYIEKKLIELSLKDKPKILFCAYATINDISKYNQKFQEQMKDLPCDIYYMQKEDIKRFDELLNWCDILYCNGGKSDDLVDLFIKNGFDKILKKYEASNKLFAGVSAGAMLYTIAGMGDKYAFLDNFKMYNYKMVKCLGLLPFTICPHYQNPELIIYNDAVKNYNCKSFAIEDDTMLYYDNGKFKVFKANKKNSVYLFDNLNDYLMIPLYEDVI